MMFNNNVNREIIEIIELIAAKHGSTKQRNIVYIYIVPYLPTSTYLLTYQCLLKTTKTNVF